jgi:hypothetical protein
MAYNEEYTANCLFCLETTNEERHKSHICNCELSYHTTCYNKWTKLKSNTCPICRKTSSLHTNETTHLLIHTNDTISFTNNIFSRRNTTPQHILISRSEYEAEQQRTKKIFRILLGFGVIVLICVVAIIVCG